MTTHNQHDKRREWKLVRYGGTLMSLETPLDPPELERTHVREVLPGDRTREEILRALINSNHVLIHDLDALVAELWPEGSHEQGSVK